MEKNIVTFWFIPAICSALVPFGLAIILKVLPLLKSYRLFADYSFPFSRQCLSGMYLTFALSTLAAYIVLGFVFAPNLQTARGWRESLAGFMLFCSMALLFFIFPLLSAVWSIALICGYIPESPWGECYRHGPWWLIFQLKQLLIFVLLLPFPAMAFSALSFIFKPGWSALIATIVNFIILFILFWSHGWLID